MKACKIEIYWQCDLMAMKKSNVACVHRQNISQYDSGERCGPWASCLTFIDLHSFTNFFYVYSLSNSDVLSVYTCFYCEIKYEDINFTERINYRVSQLKM